jgi:peptide deformylase
MNMNMNMSELERRRFLWLSSVAGLGVLTGCATRRCPPTAGPQAADPRLEWHADEQPLITADRTDFEIVVRDGPRAAVLRKRARPVPPGLDLAAIEKRMISTMESASGVGIAGPQVGLSLRVAALKLDYKTDHPHLVFVRNPVIVERSDETVDGYEGCLSVPGVGGLVRRNRRIRIEHTAIDGTIRTAEAEDHNAVLWQHELDHLDGILYLDRLLGELLPMDEVRRLREELEAGDQARLPGDLLEGATILLDS